MLTAAYHVGICSRDSSDVVGKSAAGEHHGATHADAKLALLVLYEGAADRSALDNKAMRCRICQNRNPEVEYSFCQSSNQRVPARDLNAPSIYGKILEMAQQPLDNIDCRGQRARRAKKGA